MSSVETRAGKKPEGTAGGATDERKASWPEVVGMSFEEAKKVILKDKPDANVVAVLVGSPVTMDYRTDRVRVFVDTVARTPTVG